jgi:O-methyltransferase
MMAAALTLARLGIYDREMYLFDTFTGPPPASAEDVASPYARISLPRRFVRSLLGRERRQPDVISPAEVSEAVGSAGYPQERVHVVEGPVEETVPGEAPDRIALLRLDTDQYESTRHELTHLYPRLAEGGVLIVDDYGHYPGARRAVDEYFESIGQRPLLCRLDYTARLGVKHAAHSGPSPRS